MTGRLPHLNAHTSQQQMQFYVLARNRALSVRRPHAPWTKSLWLVADGTTTILSAIACVVEISTMRSVKARVQQALSRAPWPQQHKTPQPASGQALARTLLVKGERLEVPAGGVAATRRQRQSCMCPAKMRPRQQARSAQSCSHGCEELSMDRLSPGDSAARQQQQNLPVSHAAT